MRVLSSFPKKVTVNKHQFSASLTICKSWVVLPNKKQDVLVFAKLGYSKSIWSSVIFTSFAYSPSTTTFLQSFSSDLSSQSCFKSHLFSRGWQEPSLHVNSSSEHFVSVKNWVFSPSQNLSLVIHFFLPTGRPSCLTKIDIFLIPYFISTSKSLERRKDKKFE